MIRRAIGADSAALLGLIRDFHAEDGHEYDEAHVLGALTPLLDDVPGVLGQVWLLCDPEPVGYAVLTWGWGLESGGREGLLDELFVAGSRRSRGLGATLLSHVIDAARTAGCRTLFLETERANDRARAFYARHGLVEEDSVWMRTELGAD